MSPNSKIMAQRNQTSLKAEPGKQDVVITREFNAPLDLVWKAHTDAEMIKKWLGPRELTMTIDKFEPYPGGSYRYTHSDKKGNHHTFRGVVHEVIEGKLIIQTFEYEGMPEKGHAALDTTKFESLPNGRTRITVQSLYQSIADRDGIVQSGMERGVNDSHERLEELLAN